ncbi:hypothetical protein AMTR_s00105p00088160 [Amborella trichopoda]|uniref:Uncharacterized protein n=1 Tax=Amborella trichopoda TaxID=13333 RepID=W1NWN7_AMBTC|nr:hypothetical protein AMTR_s00105p00088160 [Amborella trichopoda]
MVSYSNIDYSISFQTNPVIFDGPNPDHHTRNVLLDLVIRERTTIRSATVAHDLFRPVIKVSCSIIPASSTQELQTLDSTFVFIFNEFQLMQIHRSSIALLWRLPIGHGS